MYFYIKRLFSNKDFTEDFIIKVMQNKQNITIFQ